MEFWMLRTIDQAGYYETRLILMAVSLAIAGYFSYYKRDKRYLVMFICGALLQMIAEYALQFGGFRGATYTLSIFGMQLPGVLRPVYQGLTEGGSLALFAFWFADLRSSGAGVKSWLPFAVLCGLVVALSFAAGSIGRGGQITSSRPMFAPHTILAATAVIFFSLWVAWRKDAVSSLVSFFGGLLLFAILNYEPLQVLGGRYIGVRAGEQFAAAPALPQIVVMLLSHIFEASGGKLHYFMIPFAMGLVALKEKEPSGARERYSTQHLQDLAQRGWRKRSKPFQK